jgi:hypothetical protein
MATRKTYSRLTSGFSELDKKLAELKTGLNNTIIRKGQRAECRIILQAMRNHAPNKLVKRSLGMRVGFYRGKHVAKVGVNVGKKALAAGGLAKVKRIYGHAGLQVPAGYANPVAAWFILGTAQRYRKLTKGFLRKFPMFRNRSSRGYTGRMKPIPGWASTVYMSVGNEAKQIFEQVVWSELHKIWNKK